MHFLSCVLGVLVQIKKCVLLRMLLWLLCVAVKQLLRRRVRRVYLLLLKKCGPSGRRRRSVLMRG